MMFGGSEGRGKGADQSLANETVSTVAAQLKAYALLAELRYLIIASRPVEVRKVLVPRTVSVENLHRSCELLE